MAFELIAKRQLRKDLDEDSIRVTRHRIILNNTLGNLFAKKGFVEIYIDRVSNKVGLKPSVDSIKGFKIQKKGADRYFSCSTYFASRIPASEYNIHYDDGLYTFAVEEIASEKKDLKDI